MKNQIFKEIEFSQVPVLSFRKWGNGPRVLLAFHGFGQSADAYRRIAEKLGDTHTVFSFDLFYHGGSIWPEANKPITKQKMGSLIEDFLHENKIDRFSIAGFSLGAKISLALFEIFPWKVEELLLIAPEGIRINDWYRLATGTELMRLILKTLTGNPLILIRITHFFSKIGLVNQKVAGFVIRQLEYEENRSRIYHTWVVYRKLKIRVSALASLIRKYGTRVVIFLGDMDKVITRNAVKPLLRKLPDQIELKMIPSDHNRLLDSVARYIEEKGL